MRVLIVGGGIGGLTAAAAFGQLGASVDLVEIQTSSDVAGVGIIQPNNTLRALDRLGLAAPCVEAGAAFPGWRLRDATGNVIADVHSPDTANPQFPPVNALPRARLREILLEGACAAGARIHFGASVDDLSEAGGRPLVKLSTGDVIRCDLVVACDGVRSAMRHHLFGPQPAPRFTGQGVWRCDLTRPPEVDWGEIHFGAKSKIGLVPLSRDGMYMFLVTPETGDRRFAADALHLEMRTRLAEYGAAVAELATQIDAPAKVIYRPLHSVLLPPPWHKGRTVVIGDAAHASTPHLAQGAAMAIEDAVLLAEMTSGQADPADCLEEFAVRRYRRTSLVSSASATLGDWELREWSGDHPPEADPGGLLRSATLALMGDF